jgi:hypothetical protein
MTRQISEPDWKLFRQLRSVALERFCERTLSDAARLAAQPGATAHERYLAVFDLIRRRDRELAESFEGPRRSTALLRLLAIRSLGLLTEEEVARFGPETRAFLQAFSGAEREEGQ